MTEQKTHYVFVEATPEIFLRLYVEEALQEAVQHAPVGARWIVGMGFADSYDVCIVPFEDEAEAQEALAHLTVNPMPEIYVGIVEV